MHQNSKAARRYAKALLEFSLEQKDAESVSADMKMIAETCKSSSDLVIMLKSPVVKADQKRMVLNKVFAGHVGTITMKFLDIMTKNNREDILPEIANVYELIYREHQGIVTAEITTAIPLTEDSRKKALAFISNIYNKVELTEKVDKSLIGGFIIRVGDKQYDESVARKLNSLKREFSKNPYIAEL
jgi:F-type H+-transporting ATPase subunit delta